MTRRDFLKLSLTAAAALKLGGCSLSAKGPNGGEVGAGRPSDGLPRRRLGRTGQDVTILGMGGAFIARTPKGQDMSEAHSRQIVEAALEGGVRYFDTSPDYIMSEERLGPALRPWRDKIFLTTKTNYADPAKIREELGKSLTLLQTDHVDLLLLHCVGLTREMLEPQAVLGKGGALDCLRQAKRQGQTRFIGMSIHLPPLSGPRPAYVATTVGLDLLAASNEWDVVMPWVNYISRAQMNAEGLVVEPARRRDIGVIAMKVLGGEGQLADDYDRALGYALGVPGVACAIVGVKSPQEIQRAIQAARQYQPLTPEKMQETVELGRKLAAAQAPKAQILHRKMFSGDAGSMNAWA